MSEKSGARGVILSDSLQLPEFSREIPIWTPVVVRAVRNSVHFETPDRITAAIETPQTPEEQIFGQGLCDFLKNEQYIVMVLTHYETWFSKPYKDWTDDQWHYVAHSEAQVIFPRIQEECLSEGDIKYIWGEEFLTFTPEQRVARVEQLLTIFLYQVLKVAITRSEIKQLIKTNRSDTVVPLVTNHPSSKPPMPQMPELEDQFQHYFAQIPAELRKKEYELHHRFVCFRNSIVDAFQEIAALSSLSTESQGRVFARIHRQTGIPYDVIKKIYYVYTRDPECVKNPHCFINHILDQERSMAIKAAKRELEKDGQSIASIKRITQGLTSVRRDNPQMPEELTMQIETKEGHVACLYADEKRMVVRFPRLEYDIHKVYETVRREIESQKASGNETISQTTFQNLRAMLVSQIDTAFNGYYTQIAYNESPSVLAKLREVVEGRLCFHVEHIAKILAVVEGLKKIAHDGFDQKTVRESRKLFEQDTTEWQETMAWLSNPATAAFRDMSDREFQLVEQHVAQVIESRNYLANVRMAKKYFARLKEDLHTYVSNLLPSEQIYAHASMEALAVLEQKWRSFGDCYDALSKSPHESQELKQEFFVWINPLCEALAEQKKQLDQAAKSSGRNLDVLEVAMCRGQVADSVWGWAQKQYDAYSEAKSDRLQSAAFIPLVRRFSLDEQAMKIIWQEWSAKMIAILLNNQMPLEKEAVFEMILATLPHFDREIGRFPKVYPELWYINPEKYLGSHAKSKIPLSDALMMSVSTERGDTEQWQLLYTLGTIKLRKIADVSGGKGSRAQTMFTSEGN